MAVHKACTGLTCGTGTVEANANATATPWNAPQEEAAAEESDEEPAPVSPPAAALPPKVLPNYRAPGSRGAPASSGAIMAQEEVKKIKKEADAAFRDKYFNDFLNTYFEIVRDSNTPLEDNYVLRKNYVGSAPVELDIFNYYHTYSYEFILQKYNSYSMEFLKQRMEPDGRGSFKFKSIKPYPSHGGARKRKHSRRHKSKSRKNRKNRKNRKTRSRR
jgi:hypothetical protein